MALEVTSETGHATYVFRLMDPARFAALADGDALTNEVARSVARLNRAVLLNFRREPLYLPEDQMTPGTRFGCYRVALRLLPYLRDARAALIGRAIHDDGWQRRIEDIVSSA